MNERFQARKIAILGSGLIGGAVLRACRQQRRDAEGSRSICDAVSVYDTSRETEAAIARSGLTGVTIASSAQAAVLDTEIVFLCVPLDQMRAAVEQALPGLAPRTIVTDVASVKGEVAASLGLLLKGKARWVPGHPMAGSEKSGFNENEAAGELFNGAAVILTPAADTDPEALRTVSRFWEAVGGRVVEMSPAAHDRAAARISHLPHLAAAALAKTAGNENLELAGPGFRDATRIAAAPASLWKGILMANRRELGAALDELLADLQKVRSALAKGEEHDLDALLRRANEVRGHLPTPFAHETP